MIKLTRTINSLWRFFIILSLLIGCNPSFGFFKKPEWLHLPKEDNFWAEMSKDFAIECDENNPSIQKQIRWYQQHPKHLQRILKDARPFIYYVFEQTHRKNLPAELALIPLLESQYNPAIGAKSGAAGLWQIMPGTGTKFGLKINHSYDGRRDVTASTKAALTYLSYLHRYFRQNWLLALAAYDAGEGKVQSLAQRHSNFWMLPLSRETKEYVPKLLAIAHIIKQHNNYNLSLPHVANQPTLQEITWNEANVINVAETAKNLGIDDKTFHQYNPGIRKNVASVPHHLTILLPGTNTSRNLQQEPGKEYTSFERTAPQEAQDQADVSQEEVAALDTPQPQKTYKVKNHDTLKGIAKKFHVSIADIKQNNHLSSNNLRVGKILKIPGCAKKSHPHPETKKNAPPKETKYKIRTGDTLSSLSKKFHVSIKCIKNKNKLHNEKQLKIGRTLVIPSR